MTYQQGNLIQNTDYNTFVGPIDTANINTLNAVIGQGTGAVGYGQASLPGVNVGDTVSSAQWSGLISNISALAVHQGSSIQSMTPAPVGNTVLYIDSIPSNLAVIYNNRMNSASQGGSTSNTATYGSTWTDNIVFTHTIEFAGGDEARYFFNAGGQLKLTAFHPAGGGINTLFDDLASNIGTVVMSSVTTGTVSITGIPFNGITKVGGGGNSPSILSNSGYYSLNASNANIFTQTASTGPVGYDNSSINIKVKTNGTQGVNGDAGNVITFYTTWQQAPTGLTASIGSETTVTVVYPETTTISNTWGAVSVSGTVAGS